MRTRFLLVVGCALAVTTPAYADLIPMSGQGSAVLDGGGGDRCRDLATKDAFRDAAEKLLRRIATGPVSSDAADAILADPGSVVRGFAITSQRADATACHVTVDVNIDDRRLKRAMEEHFARRSESTARSRSPVAVALRYIVDDRLAPDSEYASNEFQRRLASQNIEIQVIGGSIHTSFEKQQYVPRYSIGQGPVTVDESSRKAMERVTDRLWGQMRQDVTEMVKIGNIPFRNLDILAAGEVQAVDKGPNPTGSGHVAGAFATVKVQRLRGDDVASASSDEINVIGLDRSDAIRTATQRAAAQLADRVASRIRATFDKDDRYGKQATLTIRGGSYSREVLPFVSALEEAGAKIVDPGFVRAEDGGSYKSALLFPGGDMALQKFIARHIRESGSKDADFNIIRSDEIVFCLRGARECR